jgi:hypothetical protein
MTRRAALFLVAVLLVACQKGDGAAVSFRWRLVDKGDKNHAGGGAVLDPANFGGEDGSCVCVPGDDRCAGYSWRVARIKLLVRDPATLFTPSDVLDEDVTFPCRQREATTPFVVPPRDEPWALSLRAFDPADPSAPDQGTTPAPEVRYVSPAEITNLDAIEVAVRALPAP